MIAIPNFDDWVFGLHPLGMTEASAHYQRPKGDPTYPPGANVRHFRSLKGWTQKELAERTQMPYGKPLTFAGISRLENNISYTSAMLRTVAEALGVPLVDILTPLHLLHLPPALKQAGQLPDEVREPLDTLARHLLKQSRKSD